MVDELSGHPTQSTELPHINGQSYGDSDRKCFPGFLQITANLVKFIPMFQKSDYF